MSFFSGKKKLSIIALSVAVLVLGAVGCNRTPKIDERAEDPEKYVRLALVNMYESLNFSQDGSDWIYSIFDGRHQIELGFSLKDIDIVLPIDRQALAMAQLARFDMDIVRDTDTKEIQAGLNLSVGGAPALGADAYISEDEFALRLPQGFDYFITLNPRRATSALADSMLGEFLDGAIMTGDFMDGLIYEIYSKLFASFPTQEQIKLVNDTEKMFADAEYRFIGEDNGLYTYSLLLKGDSFSGWYRSLVRSLEAYELFQQVGLDVSELYHFAVTGDIDMTLQIRDDFVEVVDINSLQLLEGVTGSATITMNGDANPFDNFVMTLRLENPNSTNTGTGPAAFDIADVLNTYIMIDDMPEVVNFEIQHIGDSSNPDVSKSVVSINMWPGDQRTEESDLVHIFLDYFWDSTGDKLDNFELSAGLTARFDGETGKAGFNISGTVLEDREKKEILTNFNDISLNFTDFDEEEMSIAVTLKFNLRSAPDADIGYNRATAVSIAELTPLQLLRIVGNFSEDPLIGGLIGLQ